MAIEVTISHDPQTPTLTTAQVKAWLNIPAYLTGDDSLINDVVIPDALDYLTRRTGRSFVKRQYVVVAEAFADLDFEVADTGRSGWALKHYDAADTLQTVGTSLYRVEEIGDRVVVTGQGAGLPTIESDRIMPVRFEFEAEVALDGTARAAALAICAVRYANRGDDWTERLSASAMGLIDLVTTRRAY
ncbi:MAG: hypothetical protein AAGH88_11185 [Planctomycetota bacterium]